jgi:hypothetical protein
MFNTEHPSSVNPWFYEFWWAAGAANWQADLGGTHVTLGPQMRSRTEAIMR